MSVSWTEHRRYGWQRCGVAPEIVQAAHDRQRDGEALRERLGREPTVIDLRDAENGWIAEHYFTILLAKWGVDAVHGGGYDLKPDYLTTTGARIDLKCRHVADEMRHDYDVQVIAEVAVKAVDFYVFSCYEPIKRRMTFLGAAAWEDYLHAARLQRKGERVYGITWGMDALVLPADDLYAPRTLARALR